MRGHRRGTWGGHRVVDCGSPESDYLVVHRIARDGRCHPDYDLFELDGSTIACGILDVRVGDCVHQPSFGLGTKVRCADPAATLLVTAVEATAAGESACTPDSEVYWVYGEAALTHCFKAVPALV
ncbi:hypothetical protein [Saccharopolyspora sp. CA-218241]|uniref:hypothetical protein n=1 Tax=Saccharopolyspora sp. CA-218241 TaxID=3240027 RepID=UPI003D98A8A9